MPNMIYHEHVTAAEVCVNFGIHLPDPLVEDLDAFAHRGIRAAAA